MYRQFENWDHLWLPCLQKTNSQSILKSKGRRFIQSLMVLFLSRKIMLEQKELSFLIKTLCCVYLFLSAERCYRHKAFNTEYKKSSDRMALERFKHSYISSRNKRFRKRTKCHLCSSISDLVCAEWLLRNISFILNLLWKEMITVSPNLGTPSLEAWPCACQILTHSMEEGQGSLPKTWPFPQSI